MLVGDLAQAFFLTATGLIVFHFALYPLLLLLISTLFQAPLYPKQGRLPTAACIVMAAHNEEKLIEKKLLNSLAQMESTAEVLLVSDGSSDNTVPIARSIRSPRLRIIELPQRLGKAAALNVGISLATADVVVLTDANAVFADDAVEKIVAPFADPYVGAASGSVTPDMSGAIEQRSIGRAEQLYWSYEEFLRRLESTINSTVAVVGPLLAVRRTALAPLPPGIINDDSYRALSLLKKGWRVLFVPDARCWRNASRNFSQERERRARIAAGRYQQISRADIWPIKRPLILFFFVSHKILRLLLPMLALVAFVANLVLASAEAGNPYNYTLLLQLAAYGGCVVHLLAGRIAGRRVAPAYASALMNVLVGSMWGLVRYIRKSQPALWKKADR